ncbi:MAG: [protein-PII] uridylyltransferase [Microthrixaceae bacterium]|nr:[protein-PII] uridylyltransferase [Microthrixaceae bacterium]
MTPPLKKSDLFEDDCLRGRAFTSAWTDRVDDWLRELYREAATEARPMALVAVGGQGRREMAPQSDLDLLLLFEGREAPSATAEGLWYPIWDAGLKLGHAVRTVRDTLSLASEDLETATSLLSARHLCGDPDLTTELVERSRANWRKGSKHYLRELAEATDVRHAETAEVAFALEPDLKEGRGGLRDVHALGWALAAGAPLDADMVRSLGADHDLLLEVRIELHRRQGRPGDALLLQEQDAVARSLGDEDADALMARVAEAGRRIAYVSDEGWHDIKVSVARTAVAGGARLGRRRNRRRGDGLEVRDGRICLIDEMRPPQDPFEVLRIARVAAVEQLRIGRATLNALVGSPPPPSVWPRSAATEFCELLGAGHTAVPVIEVLEQRGLWTRLIPEWRPAVCRPQRNAYHRFTVDRHLLECAAEASALQHSVSRGDLLMMGALLHDIGKAYPELGDHSEHGAPMAAKIARRMGFAEDDVATVECLVRHHLLLPDVATRRDVSDPATAKFVAETVGSSERIALLRALTEADSIATGPAAWSDWKAGLVEQLATRAMEYVDGRRDEPAPEVFPTVAQRRLLERSGVHLESDGDRILVACDDRPGVFARVAGALALHGLDVVEANIHSEGERALDEFKVRVGPSGVVPWERVCADVTKVLEGRLALASRVSERARTHSREHHEMAHQFAPEVRFDNGDTATDTVVEVVGPDSVGLLYRLARALGEFNLDIKGARIHTMGPDVVDSFYVRDANGERITDEDLQQEINRALMEELEQV